MIDPFGVILARLRADTAVLAIVGSAAKVSSEFTSAPCVVLTDLASTRRPFGPGSGRLGMLGWTGVAKCYGSDTPTGAIQARQLGGEVSDALHDLGRYDGTSGRVVARTYAPEVAGLLREPPPPAGTHLPRYDVSITAYVIAEAVA